MVRRAFFAPVALSIAAIWFGVETSSWWYLSIPFLVIGWFSATPNLNMADGCLGYLFMMAGFVLLGFHRPSGLAISAGAIAGFYLSALEMRITAKAYLTAAGTDPESRNQQDKPSDPTDDRDP